MNASQVAPGDSSGAPLIPVPIVATQRVRLRLAYDGTAFLGWAIQPDTRTVQGCLEEALSMLMRRHTRTVVAGRTDTGVHAKNQHVHFDAPLHVWQSLPGRTTPTPSSSLVRKLNKILPRDIVVHEATEVPDYFDARFAPLWRSYTYRMIDSLELRNPSRRYDTLWVDEQLDVEAMNTAAQRLLGQHDFLAYCKPRVGATTIRTLLDFRVERLADGTIAAHLRADAFCHNMVRALMGAILKVGKGIYDVEWPYERLLRAVRNGSAPLLSPHGLTLEDVAYPPADQWEERAQLTRARRKLS